MQEHPGPWRHLREQVTRAACYRSRTRPPREEGPFAFEEAAMPGTNNHQAGTRRAAIYARVSDKS